MQTSTTDLSLERQRQLAASNDWSLAFAKGFLEGDAARRKGELPSVYHRVGNDEYVLGFRAGFFERTAARTTGVPARKVA